MDKRNQGKIVTNGNCTCCGKKLNGNNLFLCNECQIKVEEVKRKAGEEVNQDENTDNG